MTFVFQDVQLLNATEASLRFLPAPVSGAISNIVIGNMVHRINANWLILVCCSMSLIGPLVMAFSTPTSSYWSHAFIANVFNPVGADSLFVIANLLITSVFPAKTQGLAGGVFNTVFSSRLQPLRSSYANECVAPEQISQIGKSVGLALAAVIAASVTAQSEYKNKESPNALLKGYIATFWFSFALILSTIALCLWGLRRVGKVGHKRD